MNKTGKILLALAVVVVIAVGAVLIANMNQQPASDNSGNDTQNNTNNSQLQESTTEPAVTIAYDGNGFKLSANTIKAGETVKVVNNSSKELDFASDPHPVHTDNSELNAGPIAAGESRSFVLNTKGTWGFHNHLDASQHGSLMVE